MHIIDLRASVGYGIPQDNSLLFIFHLSKHPENVFWSCVYSFSQLCKIDQLISKSCGYVRHSHFPYLLQEDIQPLVQYLTKIKSGSKLHRPLGTLQSLYQRTKETEKHIVSKLQRLCEIIETWFHLILLRFHIFPFKLKEELMGIFCLPFGPASESTMTKYGLDKLLTEATLIPQVKGARALTGPTNAAYVNALRREIELADSLPPLLRVRVSKGPRNERGKQEYQIDIQHSLATGATYSVSRSYSQFRSLRDTLVRESDGRLNQLLLHRFPECSLSESLFSVSEEGINKRCTYFNLWFSELLWNFPSLGARSAQLAVLKFLAVPSELWHELNKPEPATRADPETPRPSMTVRDSASAKTPTRSPGRSLLSSRSLISETDDYTATAEEEEEEEDSVWARRDAREKIRAQQEKTTPKTPRPSSADTGRPTSDTAMLDAAAAVDALASLTKRLGQGLVEGGRAAVGSVDESPDDGAEASGSFHTVATESIEHAIMYPEFSPLFHIRFSVLDTTVCGENPMQAAADPRYDPAGAAVYRGGICISELASKAATSIEPTAEAAPEQESDSGLLSPAEIFHWGKGKRSSMKSFKPKSSKMATSGPALETVSHPYKLILHQPYDALYFENRVSGSQMRRYQSTSSQKSYF